MSVSSFGNLFGAGVDDMAGVGVLFFLRDLKENLALGVNSDLVADKVSPSSFSCYLIVNKLKSRRKGIKLTLPKKTDVRHKRE